MSLSLTPAEREIYRKVYQQKWVESTAYAVFGVMAMLGKKKWPDHMRPMDWFLRYCATPPVLPSPLDGDYFGNSRTCDTRHYPRQLLDHEQKCIVCGRVHVTSEDCGVEPSESNFRDSVPRQHDGYTLERARNMGCFTEADNWEEQQSCR